MTFNQSVHLNYSDLRVGTSARVGNWIATAYEVVSEDREYYSKSWHRKYGPKRTVESRIVEFKSDKGATRRVCLSSWAGNWGIRALLDAKIVHPKKGQMRIRLNAAYEVKKVKSSLGFDFYERTLKGQHVDYCIVSKKTTSHGASLKECVAGLRAKLAQKEIAKTHTVTWRVCKSLGFCDAGLIEFCSHFGLNTSQSYDPKHIESLARSDWDYAQRFKNELGRLAQQFDLDIPEFT